jgi:hypothetical protein
MRVIVKYSLFVMASIHIAPTGLNSGETTYSKESQEANEGTAAQVLPEGIWSIRHPTFEQQLDHGAPIEMHLEYETKSQEKTDAEKKKKVRKIQSPSKYVKNRNHTFMFMSAMPPPEVELCISMFVCCCFRPRIQETKLL